MLTPNKKSKSTTRGYHFAIVASRYNTRYVDGMVKAARNTLHTAGARKITLIRVPGAFEIPLVASQLCRTGRDSPDAILCLGVIIQGETTHAQNIGRAITNALMQLQMQSGVPCVHEVLLVKDAAQARARCLNPRTNRGTEAAQTAMAMVETMQRFNRYDDVPG